MIKKFYIAVFSVFGIFLLFAAFLAQDSNPLQTNKEIIKFSHSLHSDVAECTDCHSSVPESTSLKDRLLPNHENCKNCHEVDNEKECNTCHIDETYEPLIQTQTQLIFNHKIHITQRMNCTDCHKGLDKVDYSYESPDVFPKMELCSGCHNEVKIATNACEACHISTFDLIPQNPIEAMTIYGLISFMPGKQMQTV